MPQRIPAQGHGGGLPGAPQGDNNEQNARHSLIVRNNQRTQSLRPGRVQTGTLNRYSTTVLGPIPVMGQKTPLGFYPAPGYDDFLRATE